MFSLHHNNCNNIAIIISYLSLHYNTIIYENNKVFYVLLHFLKNMVKYKWYKNSI